MVGIKVNSEKMPKLIRKKWRFSNAAYEGRSNEKLKNVLTDESDTKEIEWRRLAEHSSTRSTFWIWVEMPRIQFETNERM